jgi:hypothetical protein
LHDAEPQVRDGRRDDHLGPLHRHVADAVPQPGPIADHDRHHVQHELVEEAGGEVLPDGCGATRDLDITVAGGGAGLGQGRLDAVGECGAPSSARSDSSRSRH